MWARCWQWFHFGILLFIHICVSCDKIPKTADWNHDRASTLLYRSLAAVTVFWPPLYILMMVWIKISNPALRSGCCLLLRWLLDTFHLLTYLVSSNILRAHCKPCLNMPSFRQIVIWVSLETTKLAPYIFFNFPFFSHFAGVYVISYTVCDFNLVWHILTVSKKLDRQLRTHTESEKQTTFMKLKSIKVSFNLRNLSVL